MGKLLKTSDFILVSAAVIGEFLEDVRLVGNIVPWIYQTKYGFVPENFKRQTYLSTVSRMLSTGLIERKFDSNGLPFLELTSSGQKEFKRKFPIFSKLNSKWDGYFMQVIFDIPEKERKIRQILRLKLKELGFGMIQKSVFISPYHFEEDLAEFLSVHGFSDYVYVLTVKGILIGDLKQLANKVWKIEELNNEYLAILLEYKNGTLKKKDLQKKYFEIIESDPFLPKEFLPVDWVRDQIAKLIN